MTEKRGQGNKFEYDGLDKEEIMQEAYRILDMGVPLDELQNYMEVPVPTQTLKGWGFKPNMRQRLKPHHREFCNLYIQCGGNNSLIRKKIEENTELCEAFPQVLDPAFISNCLRSRIIQEKIKQLLDLADVDTAYVVSTQKEIIDRCMETREVRNPITGELIMVKNGDDEVKALVQFDPANALKGTVELSKFLGISKDKIEISGDKKNPIVVQNLPSDPVEASRIYAELMQKEPKE